MRNLAVLVIIGLIVYCVIDVIRSTDDERLGVHPLFWVVLDARRAAARRARLARRALVASHRPPDLRRTAVERPERRATGPDDDPDFLSTAGRRPTARRPGTSDDAPPPAA